MLYVLWLRPDGWPRQQLCCLGLLCTCPTGSVPCALPGTFLRNRPQFQPPLSTFHAARPSRIKRVMFSLLSLMDKALSCNYSHPSPSPRAHTHTHNSLPPPPTPPLFPGILYTLLHVPGLVEGDQRLRGEVEAALAYILTLECDAQGVRGERQGVVAKGGWCALIPGAGLARAELS